MFARALREVARVATVVSMSAVLVAAISVGSARAATVAEFLANPAQVMAQSPGGDAELIALIRDVLVQQPAALPTVSGLLAAANPAQQTAIGSAAGQAYKLILPTDQNYATQIAAAIAASNSDQAKTAYAAVTGDTLIGSVGGGGGGGGGGPGGGSGGGTGNGPPSGGANNGAPPATPSPTATPGTTFTGGGGSVGGLTNSSQTGTAAVSGI